MSAPTIRLAKQIANSGFCSRREGEKLIQEGRVSIEEKEKTIKEVGAKITANTPIFIDGKKLTTPKAEIYLYHKTVGLLTSHKDPHHNAEKLITFHFNEAQKKLKIIGRLDKNTEGLLLLTNHSPIQYYLESPASKIERTYHVRIFGSPPKDFIQRLAKGLTIQGISYEPIQAKFINEGINRWIEMRLIEGKNREIRNIMAYFNLKISRLKRVQYGPFKLEKLPKGKIKKAPFSLTQQILNKI